jgi:hypothetical protein
MLHPVSLPMQTVSHLTTTTTTHSRHHTTTCPTILARHIVTLKHTLHTMSLTGHMHLTLTHHDGMPMSTTDTRLLSSTRITTTTIVLLHLLAIAINAILTVQLLLDCLLVLQHAAVGAMVRSSYHADQQAHAALMPKA